MGPTWGPHGSCRTQMDPMLALWTLLSGCVYRTRACLFPKHSSIFIISRVSGIRGRNHLGATTFQKVFGLITQTMSKYMLGLRDKQKLAQVTIPHMPRQKKMCNYTFTFLNALKPGFDNQMNRISRLESDIEPMRRRLSNSLVSRKFHFKNIFQ